MGSSAVAATATAGDEVELGFAKLQGEDFEYYMQTYSIILGRNSKTTTVAVDHSSLGGGMNISHLHAPPLRPRGPPLKLDSQDLFRIGNHSSPVMIGSVGEIDEKKVKD